MYHFARENTDKRDEITAQPKRRRGSAGFAAQTLLALAIGGIALLPAVSRSQTVRRGTRAISVECERADGSGTAWTNVYVTDGTSFYGCGQLSASYLQRQCDGDVIGRSYYRNCSDVMKNRYNQWVPFGQDGSDLPTDPPQLPRW
jgi:hypothetical protein